MKKIIPVTALFVISIAIFSFSKPVNRNTINAVIGDISFLKKFGTWPGQKTNEDLRIKTHLDYAESLLRNKDVSHLPQHLQQKRQHVLNLLHNYWTAGIFPRNYDHGESRRPCFIDKNKRICAVGYLVEKTAGRETAEKINAFYKYDEVMGMNDKLVDQWIANSGLTKEECAIIQPSYGYIPTPTYNYNYISTSYGITSSTLGGLNISMSAIQLMKGNNNKSIPVIGLVSGASQVIVGIAAFPKSTNNFMTGNTTNESKKTLSMMNIGLGTTTMILSAWNLINKNKIKNRSTAVNLCTIPAEKSKLNVGLSVTKRI